MTDCHVTCYPCGGNHTPKVWRHLCTDCAAEQRDRHIADTGHDAQLHIPAEVTAEDIRRDMARAVGIAERFGW